jgi:hypothetical protein
MPKPKRALKPIPTCKSEEEEQEFWARADATSTSSGTRRAPCAFLICDRRRQPFRFDCRIRC